MPKIDFVRAGDRVLLADGGGIIVERNDEWIVCYTDGRQVPLTSLDEADWFVVGTGYADDESDSAQ